MAGVYAFSLCSVDVYLFVCFGVRRTSIEPLLFYFVVVSSGRKSLLRMLRFFEVQALFSLFLTKIDFGK